jgi:Fe-S cluster biogenesis protein NfuA
MKERVEAVLDQIRPALAMDGGGIELVNVDEGTGKVEVRLIGACHG